MPFSDQTPLMYNLIFGCSNTIHNLLVAYICWKQSVCAPLQYGAPHSALVYVGHVSVWVIFFGDYALSLFVSSPHRRCKITKKPPGSFQEPRRHTFPPKEWDPSWISQVSGWHNTRANHFVLKPPLPLSFLLPSKSRSCVEQVLGLFHSVVFTSDPLCWWMYKSAHQGVLVRSNKCGPSLHSFHENTPAAVDATH